MCCGSTDRKASAITCQRALRSQPLHRALIRFLDSSNRHRPGLLLCGCFFPYPALLRKIVHKIRKLLNKLR